MSTLPLTRATSQGGRERGSRFRVFRSASCFLPWRRRRGEGGPELSTPTSSQSPRNVSAIDPFSGASSHSRRGNTPPGGSSPNAIDPFSGASSHSRRGNTPPGGSPRSAIDPFSGASSRSRRGNTPPGGSSPNAIDPFSGASSHSRRGNTPPGGSPSPPRISPPGGSPRRISPPGGSPPRNSPPGGGSPPPPPPPPHPVPDESELGEILTKLEKSLDDLRKKHFQLVQLNDSSINTVRWTLTQLSAFVSSVTSTDYFMGVLMGLGRRALAVGVVILICLLIYGGSIACFIPRFRALRNDLKILKRKREALNTRFTIFEADSKRLARAWTVKVDIAGQILDVKDGLSNLKESMIISDGDLIMNGTLVLMQAAAILLGGAMSRS